MEIRLDIVNEDDQVLGQGEDLDMHKKEMLHRSVQTILVRNGKIYLRKRADNRPRYPAYYTTSVGIHVLSGQDYDQVAKDSLKDLYGLDLPIKFLGVFRVHDEYENEISHICAVEITDQEIKPSNGEDGEWFTEEEIIELSNKEKITPYVFEVIKLYSKSEVED